MEEMIKLQKSLLEHYIRIEGLPMYPLVLEEKESRKILRDFSYRVMEELTEATEPLAGLYMSLAGNVPMKAREYLHDFNAELGDFWHFVTEFLIYSGMTDITDYVLVAAEEELGIQVDLDLPEDTLEACYKIAAFVNQKENLLEDQRNQFRVGKVDLEDIGGSAIGPRTLELWYMGCWSASVCLIMAIHALKYKPWAQSKTQANLQEFQAQMGAFFLSIMQLMHAVGKYPDSIKETYRITNKKNHDRIKKGY